MVISHNIPALVTHLNMKKNDRLLTASMQRLSTGIKINSAKDDSAGLAIANKLAYQVSGLNKASENATNGISMIQTAEGALNEVHNMLQRMRELAVQVANGTLEDADRTKVQTEINELVEEISTTANRTEFNKIKLLNGEADRVSASYYQNRLDKAISTALYLSDNIPAGTLKYNIIQPGMPAQTGGTSSRVSAIGDPATFTTDAALQALAPSTITISFSTTDTFGDVTTKDITINITADDTLKTARDKISAACLSAPLNYSYDDATGAITIQTIGNGGEAFTIAANAALLSGLGVASAGTYVDPISEPRYQSAVLEGVALTYLASAPLTIPDGTINVYGVPVTISGATSLDEVADAINNELNAALGTTGVDYFPEGILGVRTFKIPTLVDSSALNFAAGITSDAALEEITFALSLTPLGNISGTSISINGTQIPVSAEDTRNSLLEKIENICDIKGITLSLEDDGAIKLSTLKTGGDQYITLVGNDLMLSRLGMQTTAAGINTDTYQDGKGSGSIMINGNMIEVTNQDTPASVKSKIAEICNYAGIIYQEADDGTVFLTTEIAGNNQKIYVGGDPEFLKYFGLTPTPDQSPATGSNAIIDPYMIDEAGQPILNFNNGMSYVSDGNQITITGTGGQVIKMNLQVLINYESLPPEFTYGDSVMPLYDVDSNGDYVLDADGNPVFSTIAMDLVIKDYGPIVLQIGQNYNMGMAVQIPKLTAETLGLVEYKGGRMYQLLQMETQESATLALDKLDESIGMVSTVRSRLGAYQNRLESTIRGLDTASENTESARSRIQDTDMAKEMTAYTQRNVMYQAGLSILGQANQRPQQILSLLQ